MGNKQGRGKKARPYSTESSSSAARSSAGLPYQRLHAAAAGAAARQARSHSHARARTRPARRAKGAAATAAAVDRRHDRGDGGGVSRGAAGAATPAAERAYRRRAGRAVRSTTRQPALLCGVQVRAHSPASPRPVAEPTVRRAAQTWNSGMLPCVYALHYDHDPAEVSMMVPTCLRRDGKQWRDDYTALRACCRAARDALPRLPRAEEGAFGYFSVDPVGAPDYEHFLLGFDVWLDNVLARCVYSFEEMRRRREGLRRRALSARRTVVLDVTPWR